MASWSLWVGIGGQMGFMRVGMFIANLETVRRENMQIQM
jgi:hypothetical protein